MQIEESIVFIKHHKKPSYFFTFDKSFYFHYSCIKFIYSLYLLAKFILKFLLYQLTWHEKMHPQVCDVIIFINFEKYIYYNFYKKA